jgi:hypothetical protein
MRHLKISKQITNRDEGSINRYFQEIKKYPLISTDEEIELSARLWLLIYGLLFRWLSNTKTRAFHFQTS